MTGSRGAHRVTHNAEALRRFTKALSLLQNRTRTYSLPESLALAEDLKCTLDYLHFARLEPREGVDYACRFFETDTAVFSTCDDSWRHVRHTFCTRARDVLVRYASQCDDKPWITDRIFIMLLDDKYDVRSSILRFTSEFLPVSELRELVERFLAQAEISSDNARKIFYHSRIRALARELKDGLLYERSTRSLAELEGCAIPNPNCVEIARVYFDAGDTMAALSWLKRIPGDDLLSDAGGDCLMCEIQQRLGNQEEVERYALRIFRCYRSAEGLDYLLESFGKEKREQILADETRIILQYPEFSYRDAKFLIDLGFIDDAEVFVFRTAATLNGWHRDPLGTIFEAMEAAGKPLAATVIARALLRSVLTEGNPERYDAGLSDLEKLEALAPSVKDWQGFPSHADYLQEIRKLHEGRPEFWMRYDNGETRRTDLPDRSR